MIEFLSELSGTIEDEKVRASFLSIIGEYKKLSLAFLLFPKIIDLVNGMDIEVKDVEEVAKGISIKLEEVTER